ncbi:MAG: DUF2254 domain-containing protein [Actinobacteria bacterium]|nr:DUF2254 domain-containing protein [Actinomycetota bacterium]
MIQLQALAERVRGSLFWVPMLFVAVASALAWLVLRLDVAFVDDLGRTPLLVSTTVDSARSLLSTIAGATITVAGIVFSVTVVSVQLASSQYSPRVLRNFLRDRFQQRVIGVVVATFTYCMFVLASIRLPEPDATVEAAPSLAVTVAIVLAVVSILAIVGFIDHSARSMQAGEIIERVTAETRSRIRSLYLPRDERRSPEPVSPSPPPLDAPKRVLRAWRSGWVQQISTDALLRVAPPGSYLRLDTRVGAYVIEDTPILTVWGHGELDDEPLHQGFVFGRSRTMQQDVAFGIRQLVDIGLRALSTGVNDPTTAHEVIEHLGSLLAELFQHDLPPRIHTDEEGRVLAIPDRPEHADHVDHALDQLRVAAAGQPAVLVDLLATIRSLDELLADLGLDHHRPQLRAHIRLIVEAVEFGSLAPADRHRVLAAVPSLRDGEGER